MAVTQEDLNVVQQKIHDIADVMRRKSVADVGTYRIKTPIAKREAVVVVSNDEKVAVADELTAAVDALKAAVADLKL